MKNTISVQQVLNSRFRTSKIADELTLELMDGLGLSTKANVARLALGRSLSQGPLSEEKIDVKGREIPGSSLFQQEDVHAWMGMVVTHSKVHHEKNFQTLDEFRVAVRKHWHRGILLLIDDWRSVDGNYDKFLEDLISRRADIPEDFSGCSIAKESAEFSLPEKDEKFDLLAGALKDIEVDSAEIKGLLEGPRINRYKIFLEKVNQLEKLRRGVEQLSLILNIHDGKPHISQGDENRTVFFDIPKAKEGWKKFVFKDLEGWIENNRQQKNKLIVYPGVNVMGEAFGLDLSAAPHILVGGATGQGKSVCLHSMIMSLMLSHSPKTLQLALIDPKQVEFSVYKSSDFLYDGRIAIGAADSQELLDDVTKEMDNRYEIFKDANVSNILDAWDKGIEMPFLVVFIEEMADLLIQDRDAEKRIVRLAQLARASGIHLVLATQRPDSKTFSGLIRSNIPSRIALTVQKGSESSIILDEKGAENLMGAGDMIIKMSGNSPKRVHGVYLSRSDIEANLR